MAQPQQNIGSRVYKLSLQELGLTLEEISKVNNVYAMRVSPVAVALSKKLTKEDSEILREILKQTFEQLVFKLYKKEIDITQNIVSNTNINLNLNVNIANYQSTVEANTEEVEALKDRLKLLEEKLKNTEKLLELYKAKARKYDIIASYVRDFEKKTINANTAFTNIVNIVKSVELEK
ncbi:MAG: hypothetical protein QXX12_06410 [Nanopusillaceae archaeon]